MNRISFVSVLILSLGLISCDTLRSIINPSKDSGLERVPVEELTSKDIENRCISKKYIFRKNGDDNLYGLGCIEGKTIQIKTKKEGELVVTTTSAGENLRLEAEDEEGRAEVTEVIPNVINKYYKIQYDILDNKENNKAPKWLKDLISKKFDFYGLKNKDYQILFKTMGNYLVLYKAVKNVDDLPFTERSALLIDEEGKKYQADKNGYYKVPFMGYPIEYCKRELEIDDSTGNQKRFSKLDCKLTKTDNPEFIRFNRNNKTNYGYTRDKNLLPASYFIGHSWFYTEGEIEQSTAESHMQAAGSRFVKLDPKEKSLDAVDISSQISEKNKEVVSSIPVEWKEYERDCINNNCLGDDAINFNSFKEREIGKNKAFNEKTYVKIIFPDKGTISNIVMTENYFSYVHSYTKEDETGATRRVKNKVSFLRADKVDQTHFKPRKWFKEDQERKFTVLNSAPQTERRASTEEGVNLAHLRQLHFNTRNDTVIKWHFSNYTVKNDKDGISGTADDKDGELYRGLGKRAVEVFNRAFEILTEECRKSSKKDEDCKIIKIEMAEEEDKDLGDLRYNVLNLVNADVLKGSRINLFGIAPSFVRQDTGQIIGTTTNVFIHNILLPYMFALENYIRYEVFRKDKHLKVIDENSLSNNQEHVVPDILKKKIESRCDKLIDFIKEKKSLADNGDLKPDDPLNDEKLMEVCAREVSKEAMLRTILHEMGHSFGLGHNFKASLDSENYYENEDEMKAYFPNSKEDLHEWSKSSSVMDYLPVISPSMTVLGKYDLAVLRYLYFDQVEKKDYKGYDKDIQRPSLKSLNTPLEVENQKALDEDTLSHIKPYQACWDTLHNEIIFSKKLSFPFPTLFVNTGMLDVNGEDFLCIQRDYGSNPKEIVENYIKTFKRFLNGRYRYTRRGISFSSQSLLKIQGFYNKWIKIRDNYLNSKGDLEKRFVSFGDKDGIEDYETILAEGLVDKGEIKKEYDLYYDVRESIADFTMDHLFLETMKCQVQDTNSTENSTFWIDLEDIKSKMGSEKSLYVRDCWSQDVQDFLSKQKLVLKNQRGLEAFTNYSFNKKSDKLDVLPISNIKDAHKQYIEWLESEFISSDSSNSLGKENEIDLHRFIFEPNFLEGFMNRLESSLGLNNDGDFTNNRLSLFDYLKAESNYCLVNSTIKRGNENDSWLKNSHSLSFDLLQTGIFYNKFEYPLMQGKSPERVFGNNSFLATAYTKYSEFHDDPIGFEDYLMNHYKDFIIDLSNKNGIIYIPTKNNGKASRRFQAYNRHSKRVEELEKKAGLTIREQIEKENLQEIINSFNYIIQDRDQGIK